MNRDDWQELYEKIKAWTLEAGSILRTGLNNQLHVEYKTSEADLVTEKDREIEQFFIRKIKADYPQHRIVGEEGMLAEENIQFADETVWLIDPIDGTTSFVQQKENFAISVAVYEKGQPLIGVIYDPMKDELFHALRGHGAYLNDNKLEPIADTPVKHSLIGINSTWLVPNELYDYRKFHTLIQHLRGTRIIGAAALEMAAVACGRLNGFVCLRLSPWDYAAGLAILQEVGSVTTSIDGSPVRIGESSSIFAGNRAVHAEILSDYLGVGHNSVNGHG